jgi:FkbM family methyltransferase
MRWLNRLLRSDSPKLTRPVRLALGLAMQRTGWWDHVRIPRGDYVLPFSSSNVALTYWVVPDFVDPTEEFVRAVLCEGDVFVDVGANVGTVSAVAAHVVGPRGLVVAIEPHPATFANLCDTIAVNGFGNVDCLEVACGEVAGVVELTDMGRKDDNNAVNRVNDHDRDSGDGRRRVPVRSVALADVLRDHSLSRVDLVKIDVEGFEGSVLRGLDGEFWRVAMVHVEVIEHNLRRFGDSVDGVVAFLRERGFECFAVSGDPFNIVALSSAARERAATAAWAMQLVPVPMISDSD